MKRRLCEQHLQPIIQVNLGEGPTFLCSDCPSFAGCHEYDKLRQKVKALGEGTGKGAQSWAQVEQLIRNFYKIARDRVQQLLEKDEERLLAAVRHPLLFSHIRKDTEEGLMFALELEEGRGEHPQVKRILKEVMEAQGMQPVDENIHLINLLSEFDSLIGQNKLILSSFNYGLGHDEVEKLLKTEQDRLAKSASEYAGRYKKKGDKFYEDKNYNKAIEMYSKAIEMDGDMYSAFNRRGNCYYVLEDYAKALSDFDWSTNIKRDYSIAYYNKGNCLRKLKHYKQSIAEFTKALEYNPTHADSYINKGVSHKNLKQLSQAIECYDKALQLAPFDHVAHYNRALCLIKLNRTEDAILSYEKALELQPFNKKYLEEMQELRRKAGHQERAQFDG